MSNLEPTPAPGHSAVVTDDPETLPGVKIAAVLISALVLFGVGILWSVALADQRKHQLVDEQGQAAPGNQIGKPEIGMVDQQLFEIENRSAELKAKKLQRLHSYGWVDQSKKVVHIPIEKAMEQVLAEQKR